ncbi:MAG: hypothetical protein EOM59_05085 [Clostridia bacterium]|nr:hypothetical protein [Clostridia bacterium]
MEESKGSSLVGKQLRISARNHLRPSVNFEYDKDIEIVKEHPFSVGERVFLLGDNGQSKKTAQPS